MTAFIKQIVAAKAFHHAIVAVIVLAGVVAGLETSPAMMERNGVILLGLDKFHYLKIGLGAVLTFVGVKMILAHTAWKIDTLVSLGVIVAILTTSVVWSLLKPKKVNIPVGGRAGSPLPAADQNAKPARTE